MGLNHQLTVSYTVALPIELISLTRDVLFRKAP
jgi:hypothetical protein